MNSPTMLRGPPEGTMAHRLEIEPMRSLLALCLVLLVWGPGQARPLWQKKTLHQQQAALAADKPGFAVEANYPVFAPPIPAVVNQQALLMLRGEIEEFTRFYQEVVPGRYPWHFTATFKIDDSVADAFSVVYVITARQDGAHPRYYFRGHVFSPRTGKAWDLPDYFRPGTPWLKRLSSSCVTALKKKLSPQWGTLGFSDIERGAAARRENYRTVVPTAQGLRVYFPTEQIGANVLGTQVITIPYAVFRGMMRKEGPLGQY